MNNEINLLYSKKQIQLSKLTTKVRILRLIAVGLLFIICSISLIFFLLIIASPLPSLRKEEQRLAETLSSTHEKILKQTLLSMRLTDIHSIITKRSIYGDALTLIRQDLSPSMVIMSFSVQKKEISLTVTAENLSDLETYFEKLKNYVTAKKMFKRVYLNVLEAVKDEDQRISQFQAKLSLTLR